MKHNISEHRKRTGEHTPQERISRNSAGGYFLERIDEVVQGCLEDGEEAEAHENGADVGCDPGDVLGAGGGEVVVAGPGEAEEATCEDDGAEHHGWETGFGDGEVVVCFEAGDVEALVEEVDGGAEEDADEESEEGEGADDLVPAADFLEDDWEGGEAEVEDAVDERGVEGDEEADGGCEELEGTDQVFVSEFSERHVPFFMAGVEGPVSAGETETTGFVDEEDGGVALVEEEDVHGEEEHHQNAS